MAFTGGTGDILPQVLTVVCPSAGAADDYSVEQIALPVPRIGISSSRATVFEFLWVDYYPMVPDLTDTAVTVFSCLSTTNLGRTTSDTSTTSTIQTDIEDPKCIAPVVWSHALEGAAGGYSTIFPIHVPLNDGNGNGILVATDKLYIISAGVANASAAKVIAKIGYRLVNVGTMEYVGIVQSQIS